MKRWMSLFILLALTSWGENVPDELIIEMIMGSQLYIDNPDAAKGSFLCAKRACGEDTNRLSRLLGVVARTNNAWIAEGAIGLLGWHGTAAELPFLYSMATNEQHGAAAVRAILRLEGVTSNSVCCANRYLADSQSGDRDCYYVCETLLVQAKNAPLPSDVRSNALLVARQFMALRNIYHDWLDCSMKSADATYSFSKRRLAVLRSVAARTQDRQDLLYVTNAINELVAYPEAELPE